MEADRADQEAASGVDLRRDGAAALEWAASYLERVDGLPVLAEVRIRYRLRIPKGTREAVDRALARHQERFPTAASLKSAVTVSWNAEIEEDS